MIKYDSTYTESQSIINIPELNIETKISLCFRFIEKFPKLSWE